MAPVAAAITMPATGPEDNMQEVVPGLWIGDYTAATDAELLKAHGVEYVVSAIRWKPKIIQGVTTHHVKIDDSSDADVLAILPEAVAFIDSVIQAGNSVLVHCQAGVSRSATIVAAYLMYTRQIDAAAALNLIRKVRPQASPSPTFLKQLDLFYEASFKISKKNKLVRRFYLERTAEEVMNGDGSPPPVDMFPSFPNTPATSTPATPAQNRRIRCKMCRRDLATREHMLDHGVGLPTRPCTPATEASEPDLLAHKTTSRPSSRRNSTFPESTTLTSISEHSPSSQTDISLPEPARHSSTSRPASRRNSQTAMSDSVVPRLASLSMTPTSSSIEVYPTTNLIDSAIAEDDSPSLLSAASLSSQLPPALAALRRSGVGLGMSKISTPDELPTKSVASYFSPPMLASQTCSGYFVEPMKWMEPFLQDGAMAGKIVCPNKKCNAKLGNYDWAGVRCSCKEWVTPGFCIHKSKVDEDL